MQRRRFLQFASGAALSAVAISVSGCAVYVEDPVYGPYDYYYYPDANVYFHIHTGFYFYFVDGVWIHSRTLPPYIFLSPVYRRRIVIRDREPYLRNRDHRSTYVARERERVREREADRTRDRTAPRAPAGDGDRKPLPPQRERQARDRQERKRIEEEHRRWLKRRN